MASFKYKDIMDNLKIQETSKYKNIENNIFFEKLII